MCAKSLPKFVEVPIDGAEGSISLTNKEVDRYLSAEHDDSQDVDVVPADVVMVPASRLKLWPDNPRFTSAGFEVSADMRAIRDAANAELRSSFASRAEAGKSPWDPRFPAVALGAWDPDGSEVYELQQGNCRYSIFVEDFTQGVIPTRFVKSTPTVVLSSLLDGDTGLVSKTVDEVRFAVVKTLKRNPSWGQRDILRWLWYNNRKTLYMISPTTRTCVTESEMLSSANAVFQMLFALSLLPDSIVRVYFDELARGVSNRVRRMNRDFVYSLVNKRKELILAKASPEEVENSLAKIVFDTSDSAPGNTPSKAPKKRNGDKNRRPDPSVLTPEMLLNPDYRSIMVEKYPRCGRLFDLFDTPLVGMERQPLLEFEEWVKENLS